MKCPDDTSKHLTLSADSLPTQLVFDTNTVTLEKLPTALQINYDALNRPFHVHAVYQGENEAGIVRLVHQKVSPHGWLIKQLHSQYAFPGLILKVSRH